MGGWWRCGQWGLDGVVPISPGHWPLHLAPCLQRPRREKTPLPASIGHLQEHPTAWLFSLWVCSSTRFVILPTVILSAAAEKVGLAGLVHQDRQRAAGFSRCMSVHPLHSTREPQGGDGSITSMCCPWFCDCRLHQTEEKSRLHGCICSSKFLVAGDYCVKVRTTTGEVFWCFACFCGCLSPITKGIMTVQNNIWDGVISPVTSDT